MALFKDIHSDLKTVEKEINRYIGAEEPVLTKASGHLLRAGGKRIRPAFALLAGKFYHYDLEKLIPLAVALEVIHMASLVHDDVVDASVTRRGRPTVKSKWGNRISLHTGDFLLGRSLVLISQYEDQRISRVLSRVSVEMCQGEIQQISASFDADQRFRDYLYRIKRKTALLISASCELGAVATGAPEGLTRALTRYGYHLGMAFQITDDILDLVSNEKVLGKPVGGDLRQGIITLPVIYALEHTREKERLRELVTRQDKSAEEVKETIRLIKESGAIDYAFEISQKYLEKAKKELEKLPDVKTKKTFARIAKYIGERQY
ncbi:heptaprenyl diphosphate synthase [Candidatus Formimonas warabiya]|uniref:Heptaprenyl diphosphate synthase n=1 Tax=Formimonas warabiya TaxID=1761012 RepID=A0A3G1L185_FORW1|nr:heptaprenyl diphosphate synthase [Candidatus Formimonas warabiya]